MEQKMVQFHEDGWERIRCLFPLSREETQAFSHLQSRLWWLNLGSEYVGGFSDEYIRAVKEVKQGVISQKELKERISSERMVPATMFPALEGEGVIGCLQVAFLVDGTGSYPDVFAGDKESEFFSPVFRNLAAFTFATRAFVRAELQSFRFAKGSTERFLQTLEKVEVRVSQ